MANRPSVPKFGTWDSDNVGYTVYFEKVRENKGATAPPLHRPFNPNDPAEEDAPRMIAPAAARPATSSGQQHRRTGSSSSTASEPGPGGAGCREHHRGSRGSEQQSKFAPPPQYHPRQPQPAGGHGHHHPPPAGHGNHHPPAGHGGGHQHQHHHHPAGHGGGGHRVSHAARHKHAGPRARSASPQNNAPGRQRASAVPKFGVWDESAAAQGFTVQFENVKRHREVARGAVPDVPRMPSPESYTAARRSRHGHTPFVSKMFGCFIPHTREH